MDVAKFLDGLKASAEDIDARCHLLQENAGISSPIRMELDPQVVVALVDVAKTTIKRRNAASEPRESAIDEANEELRLALKGLNAIAEATP